MLLFGDAEHASRPWIAPEEIGDGFRTALIVNEPAYRLVKSGIGFLYQQVLNDCPEMLLAD